MARGTIKKNYILNVGNQMVNILATLASTPYLSRVLGAEGIGAFSYAESIVSYFIMTAILGTGTYAPREISYVQDDIEKRSRVFLEVITLRAITTAVMLTVLVLSTHNKAIFMLMSINLIAVAFDVSWFFQGMEDFEKIVIRNMGFKILYMLNIFIFIKSPEDLLKYTFGSAVLNLITNISLLFYVPRYVRRIKISEINPFRNIEAVLSLFIPTIAIQIYTIFDKTMLGVFTETDFENGYYEQSMKMVKVIEVTMTALSAVMAPRIGYFFSKSRLDEVKEYLLKAYRFVWLISIPLAFGIMGISDNIIPWFMGPGYDKVSLLLKILPVLTVIIGVSQVTGIQYLVPTNRQKLLTKSVFIGAAVNFCMNLLLIPRFYSVGAAAASVMAEMIIAVVQLWYVRHELDVKKILISGRNYFLAGAVMLMILRLENVRLSASLVHTLIMIISGGTIYVVTLLILKDNFFCENLKQMIGKVKKFLCR